MAAATWVAGTAECMTTQSGQWSASLEFAWRCATWAKASNAMRTRHTTVATGKVTDRARRLWARDWDPENKVTPIQGYTIMDAQVRGMVDAGRKTAN